MIKIQVFNTIASRGLALLADAQYRCSPDESAPDAVILRSEDLTEWTPPDSVLAVARAGAGVNNLPLDVLTRRGIPVFNTPGANANAVKELVIAGLLLAARNIAAGLDYTRHLDGDADALHHTIESEKKQFVGYELPGRTLAVIGLGAIGVKVANAARALGMNVIGYDPAISISHAWELSSSVSRAASLKEACCAADFISLHVPLNPHTENLIDEAALNACRAGAVLINCARERIVDASALLDALDSGQLRCFVTDFPSPALIKRADVICLPHIGASTAEAQENCAVMAAEQLRDFLQQGHIHNAVNFPSIQLARQGECRLIIVNQNVPNMVGQISTLLANNSLNIVDMLNRSRDDIAITIIDVSGTVPATLRHDIAKVSGVLSVRALLA